MFIGYKYRIYPTDRQKELLEKHFGCTRLIYNLALETKKFAYSGNKVNLGYTDLAGQLIELKDEFSFLKQVNSQSLQQSLKNLDIAFHRFFKNGAKFPKPKKKHAKQSFLIPQHFDIDMPKGVIRIPKCKENIKTLFHRKFIGEAKSMTISKTCDGKYFVSILVDDNLPFPDKKAVKEDTTVGIDLGIKSFAVLSNGEIIDNPKHLKKSLKKIKYLSRCLSRKKKGSNRRKKLKHRVAKLHCKITNQRYDFLNRVSTSITKKFDTICMEDLKVSNMVKNHKLAQSINDVGWRTFRSMIEYKCLYMGKNFVAIDTFTPSSKECNVCRYVNKELMLKDREWVCPKCGMKHDRDNNASINIKYYGLKKLGVAVRTRQDAEGVGYNPDEASKIRYDDVA